MRTIFPAVLFLLLLGPAAHARPKPPPPPPETGIPVCTAPGNQDLHSIASDGTGGFYVAWRDDRNSTTTGYEDIYLQRILANGTVAPGWPVDGLALTLFGANSRPFVHADGAGGALVVWRPGNEIRAQRVDANGAIHAGWPADGKQITSGYFYSIFASTGDGHGGCYIGWVNTTDGYWENAKVTRIDADGNVVPPWTAGGRTLASDELITYLSIGTDPVDGMVYAVGTYFNAQVDQIGARVGRIPGDGGAGMSSGLFYGERKFGAQAIGDGQGGVFTAFTTQNTFPPSSGSWAQHLTATGAKAWPESLTVPSSTVLVYDGGDGTYLLDFEGSTLVARRRGSDGTLAPGWTEAGLPLASPGNRGHMGAIRTPTGFVACWAESAAGLDLRAIGVMSNGALEPGWPAGGLPVTQATGDQAGFSMLPADSGNVFIVWSDDRHGAGNRDIYAERIGPSTPVGIEPVATPPGTISFRSLVPNPARDMLHIELALAGSSPASVVLVDAGGRIRARRDIEASGSFVLPVRDLPAGIYWLSAVQGARRTTGRVVVLH